jgi:SET domain-containing protein
MVIKPSEVGAGRGLFTLKAIKKGATIVTYTGERMTQDEYDKHPSGYGVAIPGGMVIDGRSTQSSLGRYANECRAANRRAGQCSCNNAELVYDEKPFKLRIQAMKNIPANSEIFVAYGARYWKTHHHARR